MDAHPKSQLYMEPFAPRLDVFPDFPDRLVYLTDVNRYLRGHVREGVQELKTYKYAFGQRPGQSRLERELVYRGVYPLSEFTNRALHALGFEWALAHRRFKNLNKNRIENPELNRLSKESPSSATVLKELRLNFKIGLVNALWPDARVLVIIRNPLSQVASMLRLVEADALHELRAALYVILEQARQCERLQQYRSALTRCAPESLVHRAVAYWFLNYGTLIEDLERHEVTYQLVRHEVLSREPQEQRRKILTFAGLEAERQTEAYVRWSSQDSTQSPSSVMDTQRNSERYYLRALQQVDPKLKSSFFEVAEAFWEQAPDPLGEYRHWLSEHL